MAPLQFELDITPQERLALTDVRRRAADTVGDELDRYTHCFTALCTRRPGTYRRVFSGAWLEVEMASPRTSTCIAPSSQNRADTGTTSSTSGRSSVTNSGSGSR